jgi:peptidoglycan-associated lipoprotein
MTVGSPDRPMSSEPASRAGEVAPLDIGSVISDINGKLQDAFFDYDHSEVRPDAVTALQQDSKLLLLMLSDFPRLRVIIEGHCDERGSGEYNLALGDRRASRAAEVLRGFGLPTASSQTISYGKEAPQCTESAESCWRRNRRVHLAVRQ